MRSRKRLALIMLVSVGVAPLASAGHHTEEGFFKRDANGDGVVSREEYLISLDNKFRLMDANGDGHIDRHEYEKMMGSWRKTHVKKSRRDSGHSHI